MKELSIEQKAKRYDEAFRIAQELYNDPNSSKVGKGYVCTVFPKLKESEDEKIRKWIIGVLSTYEHDKNLRDAAIAWLEKQGSQILANSAKTCKDEQKPIKASYTTIVETGNGGVNTVVERELSVDGCYGKQEPFDYENANIQQKDFATKKSDQEEGIIEIPFGAKDSELQEATYYIPSGFHAEIDGNKVVIKKGNQKPAWSEEDEEMLVAAAHKSSIGQDKWLKSLKERMKGE